MGFFSDILKGAKNLITGGVSYGDEQFSRNAGLQRDFAKQGVRWRVADARAAGIHPLAALGANLPSASPITVGVDGGLYSAFGNAMGQNLSRAAVSRMTGRERAENDMRSHEMYQLEKERMQLENDALRAQVYGSYGAVSRQPGDPPPFPEEDAGRILTVPSAPAGAGTSKWKTGPTAPAEAVQQEYGEIAEWIYGAYRALNDYFRHNLPIDRKKWGPSRDRVPGRPGPFFK